MSTTPEMTQFAREAGLQSRDMPATNHPLMENDAEVRTLGDLIDARTEAPGIGTDDSYRDDSSLTAGQGPIDPEDEYMTLSDFMDTGMLSSDPDPDAGDDLYETIPGSDFGGAADITGTVAGVIRGTGTHLPLDLGASGFQIEEARGRTDNRPYTDLTNSDLADALEELAEIDPPAASDIPEVADGHRIVITRGSSHADSADDALDGTRRLR